VAALLANPQKAMFLDIAFFAVAQTLDGYPFTF